MATHAEDLKSPDITQNFIEQLRQIAPGAFTEGKLDLEALKILVGEANIASGSERYGLSWAGKAQALEALREPTYGTLNPAPEESVHFDATEHIFIEGENLEVLKILQKNYFCKIKMIYIDPPYNTGNDNFIYPDRFAETREAYLKRINDLSDTEGKLLRLPYYRKNSRENGHFHSNWLSMMYPRLFLARQLLREDGVIFISIDDNELDNLRKICDEIFGEQNRLDRGCLIWINQGSTKGFTKIVKNHEYILAYGKNADLVKTNCLKAEALKSKEIDERLHILRSPKNPVAAITFPKGLKIEKELNKVFRQSIGKGENRIDIRSEKMEFRNGVLIEDTILEASWSSKNQLLSFLRGETTYDTKGQKWLAVYFTASGVPYHKKERNRQILSSIIKDVGNTGFNDLEKIKLSRFFPYAKPVALIKELLKFFTSYEESCIILDFFAGSATTAHAVMELNKEDGGTRTFICVQIPESTDEKSEAHKAGYANIAEISKERIRRAAAKIKQEIAANQEKENAFPFREKEEKKIDLGMRVFKLAPSNFKDWRGDNIASSQEYMEQLSLIAENSVKTGAQKDNIAWEIALKLVSPLPLSAKLTVETIGGMEVYNFENGYMFVLLENYDPERKKELLARRPKFLIVRETLFGEREVESIYLGEECKKAGIHYRLL